MDTTSLEATVLYVGRDGICHVVPHGREMVRAVGDPNGDPAERRPPRVGSSRRAMWESDAHDGSAENESEPFGAFGHG